MYEWKVELLSLVTLKLIQIIGIGICLWLETQLSECIQFAAGIVK